MASLLTSISEAVYREYDRRVRRASLVTEYGAPHHGHAAHHDAEDEDAGEIANVPRGADVRAATPPATVAAAASLDADLELPAAPPAPAASNPPAEDGEDGADGEIINAPPGTSLRP